MAADETGNRTPVWLAHWARIMDGVRVKGWTWPGFGYSDGEWRRLTALAAAVGVREEIAGARPESLPFELPLCLRRKLPGHPVAGERPEFVADIEADVVSLLVHN
jgi:hypothetical protein